jgi:hypothetical protein
VGCVAVGFHAITEASAVRSKRLVECAKARAGFW